MPSALFLITLLHLYKEWHYTFIVLYESHKIWSIVMTLYPRQGAKSRTDVLFR